MRDRLAKMMKQGMGAEEMIAAGATKDFDARWGDPKLFVSTAYRGMWLHVRELGAWYEASRHSSKVKVEVRRNGTCSGTARGPRSRSPSRCSRRVRRDLGAVAQAQPASVSATSLPSQRALIDGYCVGCHNQRTKTAGIAFDTIDLAHLSERMPKSGKRRCESCAAA